MVMFIIAIQIAVACVAYHLARKQARNPIAWAVGCWIFPFAVFFLRERQQPYNPETGIFKLKGFVMDTKSGSFTINGLPYHKSAVREVQWEKHHNAVGGDAGGKITIVVNDIQHPVHHIVFRTIFADFEAHVERMKMLLCN